MPFFVSPHSFACVSMNRSRDVGSIPSTEKKEKRKKVCFLRFPFKIQYCLVFLRCSMHIHHETLLITLYAQGAVNLNTF